jgi:tRNA uridine 5-carboxymethylaminomethyl modification enzyme
MKIALEQFGEDPFDYIRELFERNPENTAYGLDFSDRLLSADRPEEAVDVLKKVIRFDRNSKIAYRKLAQAYSEIDDLVTKGTKEPYRMFTSRAEYRLLLREDNADMRLSRYGKELGLLDDEYMEGFEKKKADLDEALDYLRVNHVTPTKEFLAKLESIGAVKINDRTYWMDVIGRGDFNREKLVTLLPEFDKYDDEVMEQILVEAKYSRYIEKQQQQILKMDDMLKIKIPQGFVYKNISGLSNEIVEKLETATPPTLFTASQISGVTPAALEIIHVHIKMAQRGKLPKGQK